ncbi:MAG: CDP-alcohol phosphatidyltransferase family protein [Xanthomonadales bacterium]|nr:CDP-alcohol phosphatidyltransferase family protein [Gammaproteobacteria bacterium]MBT8052683.1 CDP-alcohol phosphatidyltransferase family protein [Gammaproteobacteria bacterium]NNK50659.1 CDP-alcohol phosphatidyltransferase family protein [Xanthomonadales bacterium]
MTIHVLVLGDSPVRLWGLSSIERLRRQLREIEGLTLVESVDALPATGRHMLLNARYLFELRTLSDLKTHDNALLICPLEGGVAGAVVDSDHLQAALDCMEGRQDPASAPLALMKPEDLTAFNAALLSAQPPVLEPVTDARKTELENRLYGNAYKGITDLVTKFLWPRPAKQAVHVAASMGMSPNTVTTIGFILVLAACYLFLQGQYLAGLAAGWIMTFLDTVDGKLARVTVQSSKFGHLYDHIIDLVHPPFWYIFWGMSLGAIDPVWGLNQPEMYWLIIGGYVGGRAVEGVFPLLCGCNVFTWRPFDAWFRLVTARRNPCLILLTLSAVIGRPEWGFIAVTFWTVLTTLALLARLIQGLLARLRGGPLESWLNAEDVAVGPNASAYRVFGSTRGAYGD